MTAATNSEMVTVSREALAVGSKSFHMASKFLAPGQRNDAATLYAFCLMVDEAADEAPTVAIAQTSLARIEDELWGRSPASTFMGFFLAMADRRDVDLSHAQNLIDGVRSDLSEVRMVDDRELLRYCYRVASTVGLMMCGVLGVRDRVALPFAVDLGVAMQLTNICRDVKEDAGLGRVYVPAERLVAVGLTPDDLLNDRVDREALAKVVRALLELADGYYQSANGGLRYIPFGPRLAIAVASRVYRAIGHKLRRHGADAWQGRTVVGTAGKVFEAVRAMVAFAGPNISGWSSPRVHTPQLHIALQDLPGANPSAASMALAASTPRLESVCP
ncbi:MAG: phytoene/squalene synthase family protein [Myxococcota bacterium]